MHRRNDSISLNLCSSNSSENHCYLVKWKNNDWRDGPAIKSTGCSFWSPEFNSRHSHIGSQPSITVASWSQMTNSDVHAVKVSIYINKWIRRKEEERKKAQQHIKSQGRKEAIVVCTQNLRTREAQGPLQVQGQQGLHSRTCFKITKRASPETHASNGSTEVEVRGSGFKVTHDYLTISRPAQDTWGSM